MTAPGKLGDMSRGIVALAARPDGVTSAELGPIGCLPQHATTRLGKLTSAGHLVRCKVPGQLMHWFVTADAAAAWRARTPAGSEQERRARIRLGLGLNTPVQMAIRVALRHLDPDAPVDESRAIHTLCPSPAVGDVRYQIDPAERPFGAGFGAVGIGRDVMTGKGWGQ